MGTATALSADQIRMPQFDFTEAEDGVVFELSSHERAREAIDLGLEMHGNQHNIYVLGPDQAGRMTATHSYVQRWASSQPRGQDWLYLQDFDTPGSPQPLALEAGVGTRLKRNVDDLIPALARELATVFASEGYQQQVARLRGSGDGEVRALSEQLDAQARDVGLALVTTPQGPIVAALDEEGNPVPIESLPSEKRDELLARSVDIRESLGEIQRTAMRFQAQQVEAVAALEKTAAANATAGLINAVAASFGEHPAIVAWLQALRGDVAENFQLFLAVNQGVPVANPEGARHRYTVNLLVDRSRETHRPVVLEQNPTYENLFGKIEYRQLSGGALETDAALIRAGSLHQANGGVLILRADAMARQPVLWAYLKAALRDGVVRIEEFYRAGSPPLAGAPKPVPIPLDVKVIIVGAPFWYYSFFVHDPEFSTDFKIRAHIDATIDATAENLSRYAAIIQAHARENGRTVDKDAMVRLLGVAARWCGDRDRLTASYEMVFDLVDEASADADGTVSRTAVDAAVTARRRRNSQLEDQVHRAIREEMTIIEVRGTMVGQINGLTVQQLGDHSFGTPARITARSSMGRRGVINIERLVAMSGPIQQKGTMVLQGLLSRRFARNAPMSFDCSVTFEQLYGGVEGDSASMAEYVAIISDLADVPIRQDVAITGSVNQLGEAQVIGGVRHKVEGFFRTCLDNGGLSGSQGVIVPWANRQNLVLRDELAEAVASGDFHIWAVKTVDEAVAVFTGMETGLDDAGTLARSSPDTVYGRVIATLERFDSALAERHL